MRVFFLFLLLVLFPFTSHAQLTVGGWFFPVSVPPPDPIDNTVYDEDVGVPAPETMNVTHQEIKDYYEKDKLEKWNNQKPRLQPVYKKTLQQDLQQVQQQEIQEIRHQNANDHASTTHDPFEISKSKQFLPGSGLSNFFPTPLKDIKMNDEPVITMSMTPIRSLTQPEEISLEEKEQEKEKDQSTEHENFQNFPNSQVSSTTEKVMPTKVPFIYELPKAKSYDDPMSAVEKEKDMIKLKRDVFRLRNEMNLVKSLLNKLYKKNFRKQRDFIMKKNPDPVMNTSTRLSAVQAERNLGEWVPFRRLEQQRRSQMHL